VPECTDFPDVGYQYASKVSSFSSWLTFRANQELEDALRGANRMHVYVCSGAREGNTYFYKRLSTYAIQVSVM
jgi:hypothetical protein